MNGDFAALTLAALGIALSPVPLLLALALLGSTSSIRLAMAFVAGSALAIGTITAVAVFLVPTDDGGGAVGATLAAVEIVVGVTLVLLLVAHIRRSRPLQPSDWWSRLGRVRVRTAFGGGLAVVVLNPKNLALAGAGAILQLWGSAGAQAVSVITFTVAAVSLLLALIAVVAVLPERAGTVLDRAQRFVLEHERRSVAVLLGLLATFFLVRGVLDVAAA